MTAVLKREAPGQFVDLLPGTRETRRDRCRSVGSISVMCFNDVLLDHPADIGPRCLAGLDQIEFFGKDDGDGGVSIGSRQDVPPKPAPSTAKAETAPKTYQDRNLPTTYTSPN